MQVNSFLGAFFRVSPFLKINKISDELFLETVKAQYVKKFGRFGDAVVASNMKVMEDGFSRVQEIRYGDMNDPDRSSMRNPPLRPLEKFEFIPTAGCGTGGSGIALPGGQPKRAPLQTLAKFDSEFRCGIPDQGRSTVRQENVLTVWLIFNSLVRRVTRPLRAMSSMPEWN